MQTAQKPAAAKTDKQTKGAQKKPPKKAAGTDNVKQSGKTCPTQPGSKQPSKEESKENDPPKKRSKRRGRKAKGSALGETENVSLSDAQQKAKEPKKNKKVGLSPLFSNEQHNPKSEPLHQQPPENTSASQKSELSRAKRRRIRKKRILEALGILSGNNVKASKTRKRKVNPEVSVAGNKLLECPLQGCCDATTPLSASQDARPNNCGDKKGKKTKQGTYIAPLGEVFVKGQSNAVPVVLFSTDDVSSSKENRSVKPKEAELVSSNKQSVGTKAAREGFAGKENKHKDDAKSVGVSSDPKGVETNKQRFVTKTGEKVVIDTKSSLLNKPKGESVEVVKCKSDCQTVSVHQRNGESAEQVSSNLTELSNKSQTEKPKSVEESAGKSIKGSKQKGSKSSKNRGGAKSIGEGGGGQQSEREEEQTAASQGLFESVIKGGDSLKSASSYPKEKGNNRDICVFSAGKQKAADKPEDSSGQSADGTKGSGRRAASSKHNEIKVRGGTPVDGPNVTPANKVENSDQTSPNSPRSDLQNSLVNGLSDCTNIQSAAVLKTGEENKSSKGKRDHKGESKTAKTSEQKIDSKLSKTEHKLEAKPSHILEQKVETKSFRACENKVETKPAQKVEQEIDVALKPKLGSETVSRKQLKAAPECKSLDKPSKAQEDKTPTKSVDQAVTKSDKTPEVKAETKPLEAKLGKTNERTGKPKSGKTLQQKINASNNEQEESEKVKSPEQTASKLLEQNTVNVEEGKAAKSSKTTEPKAQLRCVNSKELLKEEVQLSKVSEQKEETKSLKNTEQKVETSHSKTVEERGEGSVYKTPEQKVKTILLKTPDGKIEAVPPKSHEKKESKVSKTPDQKVEHKASKTSEEKVEPKVPKTSEKKVETVVSKKPEQKVDAISLKNPEPKESKVSKTPEQKVEAASLRTSEEKVESKVSKTSEEKVESKISKTSEEKVDTVSPKTPEQKESKVSKTSEEKVEPKDPKAPVKKVETVSSKKPEEKDTVSSKKPEEKVDTVSPKTPEQKVEAVSPKTPEQKIQTVSPKTPEQKESKISKTPEEKVETVSSKTPEQKVEAVSSKTPEQKVEAVSPKTPEQKIQTASPKTPEQKESKISKTPEQKVGTVSSKTPEQKESKVSKTPEQKEAVSPKTTEQKGSKISKTPEQKVEAVSPKTPEQKVEAVSPKTPERKVEAVSPKTPERKVEAVSPKTPERKVEAVSPKTPERKVEAVSPKTPERKVEAVSPKTPERKVEAVSPKTPEQKVQAASPKTPEQKVQAASPKTPEQKVQAASPKTPEQKVQAASPKTPEQKVQAASLKTPEQKVQAASPKTPEQKVEAVSLKTPEQKESKISKTPEQKEAVSPKTTEQKQSKISKTPEQKESKISKTPEQKVEAVSPKTPEQKLEAVSPKTPEQKVKAVSSKTPEQKVQAVSPKTPEQKVQAVSPKTPEQKVQAVSPKTPEQKVEAVSPKTPEQKVEAVSPKTTEQRESKISKTPEKKVQGAYPKTPEQKESKISKTPEQKVEPVSPKTPEQKVQAASPKTPEQKESKILKTPEQKVEAVFPKTPEQKIQAASPKTPEQKESKVSKTPEQKVEAVSPKTLEKKVDIVITNTPEQKTESKVFQSPEKEAETLSSKAPDQKQRAEFQYQETPRQDCGKAPEHSVAIPLKAAEVLTAVDGGSGGQGDVSTGLKQVEAVKVSEQKLDPKASKGGSKKAKSVDGKASKTPQKCQSEVQKTPENLKTKSSKEKLLPNTEEGSAVEELLPGDSGSDSKSDIHGLLASSYNLTDKPVVEQNSDKKRDGTPGSSLGSVINRGFEQSNGTVKSSSSSRESVRSSVLSDISLSAHCSEKEVKNFYNTYGTFPDKNTSSSAGRLVNSSSGDSNQSVNSNSVRDKVGKSVSSEKSSLLGDSVLEKKDGKFVKDNSAIESSQLRSIFQAGGSFARTENIPFLKGPIYTSPNFENKVTSSVDSNQVFNSCRGSSVGVSVSSHVNKSADVSINNSDVESSECVDDTIPESDKGESRLLEIVENVLLVHEKVREQLTSERQELRLAPEREKQSQSPRDVGEKSGRKSKSTEEQKKPLSGSDICSNSIDAIEELQKKLKPATPKTISCSAPAQTSVPLVSEEKTSLKTDIVEGTSTMQTAEKSREEVIKEREARKAAKLAKKTKGQSGGETKTPVAGADSSTKASPSVGLVGASEKMKPTSDNSSGSGTSQLSVKLPTTKASTFDEVDRSPTVVPSLSKEIVGVVEKGQGEAHLGDSKKPEAKAVKPEQPNKKPEDQPTKSKAELRAERRAKQEAQRAAKASALEQKAAPADSPVKKPVPAQVVPKTVKAPMKAAEAVKEVSKAVAVPQHRVKLFSHLYLKQEASIPANVLNVPNLHPAIIRLGVQYASKVVVGSNARCLALLYAMKQVIENYRTPPQKEFARGLEASLQPCMAFLQDCRPLSVSMTNALKHLKWQMNQLPNNISDVDARRRLQEAIDTYIREQIEVAGLAICNTVLNKISDGDVILTYGCSSLVQRILIQAHESGSKFRVVVVDGRPWREGKEMLRRLVKRGLKCSYVLISAASFIMREVTKVLLGAHALLANGYVMSRAGSSQVAMLAHSYNVPVLVCCETHKFSERVQTDSFVYNELGNPDELAVTDTCVKDKPLAKWKAITHLTPLNLTYDVTPPDLVTAVVTELAILPCTSVPVILRIKPTEIGF